MNKNDELHLKNAWAEWDKFDKQKVEKKMSVKKKIRKKNSNINLLLNRQENCVKSKKLWERLKKKK